MKRTKILTLAALALCAVSATAQTATTKKAEGGATEASARSAEPSIIILIHKPTYPLTVDVFSGETLPEVPIDYVKDGHLFRLAKETSKAGIDANVVPMWKKIEDAAIAKQKPTYPLTTSAVSNKPLPPTATTHLYGTKLVLFADPSELAAFQANPAAALGKLDKAYVDQQLPTYKLVKCIVTDADLDATAINFIYGTQLIRVANAKAKLDFEKNPDFYLKKLAAAK